MKSSEFFGKFASKYLWGNLLAMATVLILLCLGVKFGLDVYTHHGEAIVIPDVRHKTFSDAQRIFADYGLNIEVTDTGYVKTLPPGCILEQSPQPGEKVKSGHIIYVIVNSGKTPTITLPDIIDNSSLREAIAKLTAMGFKVGTPQMITGEKDWVYGVLVNGRHVVAGDRIPVDATVIILAGNGSRSASDSTIDYVDPTFDIGNGQENEGDIDEFDVVTPTETSGHQDNRNTPASP